MAVQTGSWLLFPSRVQRILMDKSRHGRCRGMLCECAAAAQQAIERPSLTTAPGLVSSPHFIAICSGSARGVDVAANSRRGLEHERVPDNLSLLSEIRKQKPTKAGVAMWHGPGGEARSNGVDVQGDETGHEALRAEVRPRRQPESDCKPKSTHRCAHFARWHGH